MNSTELASRIKSLKDEYEALSEARPITQVNIDRADAILDELIPLQREFARRNGEPFAEPLEGLETEIDVLSNPIVLSSTLSTYLVYASNRNKPCQTTRVIRFNDLKGISVSCVNDEVQNAHELSDRGLFGLGVFCIGNSRWFAELFRVHQSHALHDEESWAGLRHYLFAFKEKLVEVIAGELTMSTNARLPTEVVCELEI